MHRFAVQSALSLMQHSSGRFGAVKARSAWLLSVALVSSACGAGLAPVLNVDNAPVVTAAGVPQTRGVVHDAIVRALASRNWQLVQDTSDGIVASVTSGGHTATVHIGYDERTYSIHYVDSSPGLKYNGTAIHRRYNQWVDRLRASIRAQLTTPNAVLPLAAAPTTPPPSASTMPPAPGSAAPAVPSGGLPPPPPPPPPTATPGK
jgi:hypothetical protein